MNEKSEYRFTGGAQATETDGMGGCLVRLCWLIATPMALLGLAASLAKTGDGPASLTSAVYWGVVLAGLATRYLDVFRFKGETAAGKPATRSDWRGFAVRLLVVASVIWAVALGVGEA